MAGAQVPVIPLVAVVGSGAIAVPAQTGVKTLKVGTVFPGFTVMVSVAGAAHWPAFGVNV